MNRTDFFASVKPNPARLEQYVSPELECSNGVKPSDGRERVEKKSRRTISAGKVMATSFWDWKGVIHLDFLQDRRTINAEYYSNILLGEVKD